MNLFCASPGLKNSSLTECITLSPPSFPYLVHSGSLASMDTGKFLPQDGKQTPLSPSQKGWDLNWAHDLSFWVLASGLSDGNAHTLKYATDRSTCYRSRLGGKLK